MVVEHGVHPLLPLGALLHQGVTAPHAGAKVKQVRRRDPGLRESADQQKLSQMPGVSPVGLRSALLALQAARFRWLCQVSVSTDAL